MVTFIIHTFGYTKTTNILKIEIMTYIASEKGKQMISEFNPSITFSPFFSGRNFEYKISSKDFTKLKNFLRAKGYSSLHFLSTIDC